MKFNPEDVTEYATAKEGTFLFEVIEAEDGFAKESGNELINMKLEILIDDIPLTVYDWLVGHPKSLFKVKQFCRSVGMLDQFESGEVDANSVLNKRGLAEFKFGDEKTNKNGQPVRYLEVKHYLSPQQQGDSPPPLTDDDIPLDMPKDDKPF
jgi:hypothetical protein